MKIEIEFDNSYSARLTIDGREMRVESEPGIVRLKGISAEDQENTLGGVVALELYGKVADIQQAEAAFGMEEPDTETWDRASASALNRAEQELF